MKYRIVLMMLAAVAALVQAENAAFPLFDSAHGIELSKIERRNAEIRLTERGTLYVKLLPGSEWPGITLFPPDQAWNLARYTFIHLRISNVGPHNAEFGIRVDNPGANGIINCLQVGCAAVPGQSYECHIPINRKSGNKDIKMFGMRGYPPEAGGDMGEKTINPENVTGILVFGHKLSVPLELELERIWTDGTYRDNVAQIAPEDFFPCIDKFGQYIHRDWPGKTHGEQDFKKHLEEEDADLLAHPGASDWDKWGGWKNGPTLAATGFFRVQKYNGKWWLVDPDGKLFISHGIDGVVAGAPTPVADREHWFAELPGEDSPFSKFYGKTWYVVNGYYKGRQPRTFDFARVNLIRKYGEKASEVFAERAHLRFRSWGLNTLANWSDTGICLMKKTPYFATLNTGGTNLEGSSGYWGKFRDVFDPSFLASIQKAVARCKSVQDPWCIGFFVDNEIAWGNETSLAVAALASPAKQAAKIEFLKDLRTKYAEIGNLNAVWGTAYASWEALSASQTRPDAKKARNDLLDFNRKFARQYFRTIRDTLKAAAPNQLYAGCRFAWVNPLAAEIATEFCDIISYNLYRTDVSIFQCKSGKDVPLIIGEFHFGALDRGMFHTGLVATASQEERAKAYRRYVEGMLRNPQFVGCHWFKYMDEPTTGRGLDGENYQIGFLDTCDTPYPEIIRECRAIGYELYRYRAGH